LTGAFAVTGVRTGAGAFLSFGVTVIELSAPDGKVR
jgi:hypothetical protein